MSGNRGHPGAHFLDKPSIDPPYIAQLLLDREQIVLQQPQRRAQFALVGSVGLEIITKSVHERGELEADIARHIFQDELG